MSTKRTLCLLTVASAALLAWPAAAQMYPGDDVVVNPSAVPGWPASAGTYQVHKPHRHKKPAAAPTDTAMATPAEMTTSPAPAAESAPAADAAPTPPPPAPPKPAKHSHHTATAATAPAEAPQSSSGMGFSFGDDEPQAPAQPAAQQRTASNEAQQAAPAKPGKAEQANPGLAKRGAILFEHNSTEPQQTQMDGIKLLAGDLNSALEAGATQIQLEAFGGAPGDKGSDAKRIALKRALAIRQLLIDNGVPSNRIITKAMGGASDGEPDRVDIYVRA